MLEYMLCRPQDAVFFGQNLRVVVLDEAHIYSGNLAAEITFLLRRVLMRCGRKPEDVLCIATSATIGGGVDELRPFAARVFSKPENLVKVIAGKPQRPELEALVAPLPLSSELIGALKVKPFPIEDTLAVGDGKQAFHTASDESRKQWTDALAALVSSPVHEQAVLEFLETRHAAPLLAGGGRGGTRGSKSPLRWWGRRHHPVWAADLDGPSPMRLQRLQPVRPSIAGVGAAGRAADAVVAGVLVVGAACGAWL
jgi:ATP-dependent helicase YprA (DUF1998 family)